MMRIAQAHVAEAMRAVERMGTQQQVQLGDEIFAQQPNLLGSIVVLRGMGASDTQIGIALHVLFVAWLAMKASGHRWPVISEDARTFACNASRPGFASLRDCLQNSSSRPWRNTPASTQSHNCSPSPTAICVKAACSEPGAGLKNMCCLQP
jgi:hypothetical protein